MTDSTQEIVYLQSINFDNHLPAAKKPLQVNFSDDDILHCLLLVLSFYGYTVWLQ
jgi:hypothetical protein